MSFLYPLSYWVSLAVIVRRHFSDQKREFLANIDPREVFLSNVSFPVGKGKDNVHDLSHSTQARRTHFHGSQRTIPFVTLSGLSINPVIANGSSQMELQDNSNAMRFKVRLNGRSTMPEMNVRLFVGLQSACRTDGRPIATSMQPLRLLVVVACSRGRMT